MILKSGFVNINKEYQNQAMEVCAMLEKIFLMIHDIFFPNSSVSAVYKKKEPVFTVREIDEHNIEITARDGGLC